MKLSEAQRFALQRASLKDGQNGIWAPSGSPSSRTIASLERRGMLRRGNREDVYRYITDLGRSALAQGETLDDR